MSPTTNTPPNAHESSTTYSHIPPALAPQLLHNSALALHTANGATPVIPRRSANSPPVGYQNKGFENSGYTIVANTFLPVGGVTDAMTLEDIKVNDAFINSKLVFMTTGGANAKTTWNDKSVSKEYVYWPEEDAEDGAGWYLTADVDATVNCNDVPLPLGDGILVSRMSSETGAELVYSGEVYTKPVTKDFPNSGYTPIGNCSPATIKLGDITVNDAFVNSKIVFMTTGGANEKTTWNGKNVSKEYVYWPEEDAEDGAGWYLTADVDATVNCNDTITFGPGEGFLVNRMSSEAGATITLPSAL